MTGCLLFPTWVYFIPLALAFWLGYRHGYGDCEADKEKKKNTTTKEGGVCPVFGGKHQTNINGCELCQEKYYECAMLYG